MKLKWLIIGVVVCLYIGFRLWGLSASCLWFDEIFSVHAAQHPWSELFGFVAQDLIHPPLFYILLKIWVAAGGDSLLWLRLFPAVMACAALVPLLLLCRELKFSTLETSTVILLLAVNGTLIKYAQEVRMYSLLFCLACISLWLFARWSKRENVSLIPLFLCNLLLIYTHYFGCLVVFTEVMIVIWLRRESVGKWLIMCGLWVASFLPWILAIIGAYRQSGGLGQNLNWAGRPGLLQLLQFLAALHQPFYFQQVSTDAWVSVFALPIFLLCVTAVVFLFASEEKELFDLKILLVFCAAPLLIAFLASWATPFSVWGTRHLTVVFVPYFLLIAMGLKQMRPAFVRSFCYAILIGFLIPAAVINYARATPVYPWCAWGPLILQVKDTDTPAIYVFEDVVAYELWYTTERTAPGKFHITLIEDDPDIKEDKAYFLPRGFDGVQKANEESISGEKFWLAVRGIGDDAGHSLWKRLKAKGYKTGAPIRFAAEGADVFMIPVERENK